MFIIYYFSVPRDLLNILIIMLFFVSVCTNYLSADSDKLNNDPAFQEVPSKYNMYRIILSRYFQIGGFHSYGVLGEKVELRSEKYSFKIVKTLSLYKKVHYNI